jgi:hypothetical protein
MVEADSEHGENSMSMAVEYVPPVTPPSKRSGGPRTTEGKNRSSKNSLRHGLTAANPVIAVEDEAAWEKHLEGMRESWHPQGYYEDELVRRAAVCLWKRAQVDELAKGIVNQQIALIAGAPDIGADSPQPRPTSESAGVFDAASALATLAGLDGQPDEGPVPPDGAAGVLGPLVSSGRAKSNTAWPGVPKRIKPEEFDGWTAGQLRQCLEIVAKASKISPQQLLQGLQDELRENALQDEAESEYRKNLTRMSLYRATVPSGGDADLIMRYSTHFDREFSRIRKWFEEAQQARKSGLLPPTGTNVENS